MFFLNLTTPRLPALWGVFVWAVQRLCTDSTAALYRSGNEEGACKSGGCDGDTLGVMDLQRAGLCVAVYRFYVVLGLGVLYHFVCSYFLQNTIIHIRPAMASGVPNSAG